MRFPRRPSLKGAGTACGDPECVHACVSAGVGVRLCAGVRLGGSVRGLGSKTEH